MKGKGSSRPAGGDAFAGSQLRGQTRKRSGEVSFAECSLLSSRQKRMDDMEGTSPPVGSLIVCQHAMQGPTERG